FVASSARAGLASGTAQVTRPARRSVPRYLITLSTPQRMECAGARTGRAPRDYRRAGTERNGRPDFSPRARGTESAAGRNERVMSGGTDRRCPEGARSPHPLLLRGGEGGVREWEEPHRRAVMSTMDE